MNIAALAGLVAGIFGGLALWHAYLAGSPPTGESAAIPSLDGRPLFVPSRRATLAIAVALACCALLVATVGGLLPGLLPGRPAVWACDALALGLLARGIGDFRYVGLFKRVRGSRFARFDSLLYSPLCLLLAAGIAGVAHPGGPEFY